MTAEFLAKDSKHAGFTTCQPRSLKLKETLSKGVAFHHAGLCQEDRYLVERLFRSAELPVLCATSTLAAGVNLPAHLVIVKSTMQYTAKGYQEINELDLFQMMGRAGRPQYDTFGVAAILTDDTRKDFYQGLVEGRNPIESHLHHSLIEHVNAEIFLGTISNLSSAVHWIKSTFLFVRAQLNPAHYSAKASGVEGFLEAKLGTILSSLVDSGLAVADERGNVRANDFGRIMARFYTKFETMKVFMQCPSSPSTSQIVRPSACLP